jgi:hypothetical protein
MPDHTRARVIIESLGRLNTAAVAVTDGNGGDRTPCTEGTVIQVLQHAVVDQLAWALPAGPRGGLVEELLRYLGRQPAWPAGPA